MPSSTRCGWSARICRSLNVPGSDSSALQMAYFGVAACAATSSHFRPVGNPAPPMPRSPLSASAAVTWPASGRRTARRAGPRNAPPPRRTDRWATAGARPRRAPRPVASRRRGPRRSGRPPRPACTGSLVDGGGGRGVAPADAGPLDQLDVGVRPVPFPDLLRGGRPRHAASTTGRGRRAVSLVPAAWSGSAGRTRSAPRSRTAAGAPRGTAPPVPRGAASPPVPGWRAGPGSGSARGTSRPAPRRRAPRGATSGIDGFIRAGSIRTAQNLNSGILPTGSISSMVSRLAAASRKWNGMKQLPRASRCETLTSSSMAPRRELTRARSPSARPSSAASAGCTKTRAFGAMASSA